MKVMQWLIQGGHERVRQGQDFFNVSGGPKGTLNVYSNFRHISKDRFEFDVPKAAGFTAESQWRYWKTGAGTEISINCPMMVMYRRKDGNTQFYPCRVKTPVKTSGPMNGQDNIILWEAPVCQIEVTFFNSPGQERNFESEVFLIGLRKMFFMTAYAVLENLRSLEAERIPFLQHLRIPGVPQHQLDVTNNTPNYLRGRKLSFQETSQSFELGDTFTHTLAKLKRFSLSLDHTQLQAFASAITQPVSLIQGPPGTGKRSLHCPFFGAQHNFPLLP